MRILSSPSESAMIGPGFGPAIPIHAGAGIGALIVLGQPVVCQVTRT